MQNKGEAHLDAVDITYVPEDSVRNGQFLQGQVDVVWPQPSTTLSAGAANVADIRRNRLVRAQ